MKELLHDQFDPVLLKAWFILRFNPSEACLLTGRRKDNASRKLTVEDFRSEKYDMPVHKLAKRLREQLFETVRSTTSSLPSGASIGVLTSGGIDSTSLLSILVELGYEPKALSLGFGEQDDEIQYAKTAAKHFGVPFTSRTVDRVLDSTAEANSVLDEPYRAACVYYEAIKFAKESGAAHLFDGLGVDEFYGGYGFRYEKVQNLVKSGLSTVESYVRGAHPCDYTDDVSMLGPKIDHVKVDWDALFPCLGNNGLSLIDRIFLTDYNSKCRQNFIPLARHGKKLGVKIYYPWLADDFVSFSLRIPAELKYDSCSGATKILFRKAVADLVPEETMARKKQGFSPTPRRVYEHLRGLAERKVLEGRLVSSGYLNRDYYERVLSNDCPTVIEINKLWDAYTFEAFLELEGVT